MTKRNSIAATDPKQAKEGLKSNSDNKNLEATIGRMNRLHGVAFKYSNPSNAKNGVSMEAECLSCNSVFIVSSTEHNKRPNCQCCGLSRREIVSDKKHKLNLARVLERHGDRYNLNNSILDSMVKRVSVTCNNCGDTTKQTVANLVHTSDGCLNCYNKNRAWTQIEFLEKANSVHGDKYSYEKTNYLDSKTKVVITCLEHGDFHQSPSQHLKRHGCPECGKAFGGWSRTRFRKLCERNGEPLLYVIRCSGNDESFYKIGITSNDLETRFEREGYLPYEYEAVYQIGGKPDYIYDLEVRLHSIMKSKRYKTNLEFGGHTECFTTIKPIEKLLKRLTSTEQIQLIA